MNELPPILDFIAQMSRRDHPETSREAAACVAPSVPFLRSKVLAFLRERGPKGATDMEIDARYRHLTPTMRPRRVELVRVGLVADSGRKVLNSRGRSATVWILAEEDHAV